MIRPSHASCVRLVIGLVVGLLASCVIPDVDYAGRPCPDGSCPDGFACAAGVCQSRPSCSAALQLVGFKASWQTPNTIQWEWVVTGDTSQFNGYELTLTSDRADAGGAKTWTYAESPELGHYKLPTTIREDYVLSTITHGLDEDTEYHARLTVKDKAGAICSAPSVDAHTAVGTGLRVITLFDNGFGAGAKPSVDAAVKIVNGAGGYGSSTSHLEVAWDSSNPDFRCDASKSVCYANFHVYGLNADTSAITQIALDDTAFLEFAISYTAVGAPLGPSWWSSVGLCQRQTSNCFVFEPYTIRSEPKGQFRVVQIPLRLIGAMPLAALETGIDAFFFGGEWAVGSQVIVDKVSLKY